MSEHRISNLSTRVFRAEQDGFISQSAAKNIERWLTEPAFQEYLPQLAHHINSEQWKKLNDIFWEIVPFGTGGRRGTMYPIGTACINARTIGESAQGLADYYLEQRGCTRPALIDPSSPTGRAVIAYDSRHRSVTFARLAAEILVGSGFLVFFFPKPKSTPQLSFAVRHLNCDVGIMISASHNPPADNGFKCYWSDGGQVLPPHDRGIIDKVYHVTHLYRKDFNDSVKSGSIEFLDASNDQSYLNAVCQLSQNTCRDIRILFTPLHGVGESSVFQTLKQSGFQQLQLFEPQATLDGDFPHVPGQNPNPEDPLALEPAIKAAEANHMDLVLASDPDADRLAVAIHNHDETSENRWICLTGNQTGALLVDHALRHRQSSLTSEHFVVKTLVTTELVTRIADYYGVQTYGQLLVGFKYIARQIDLAGPSLFILGVEESLGYLAGTYARDKDAAIAALLISELAAELQSTGQSVSKRMDEIYLQHGFFSEMAASRFCTGPQGTLQIQALMAQFRNHPPLVLDTHQFVVVHDYGKNECRQLPENTFTSPLETPEGDLLFFETGDPNDSSQFRFAVRPSGTEPKIKFYFYGSTICQDKEDLEQIKQDTRQSLVQLKNSLLKWVDAFLEHAPSSSDRL